MPISGQRPPRQSLRISASSSRRCSLEGARCVDRPAPGRPVVRPRRASGAKIIFGASSRSVGTTDLFDDLSPDIRRCSMARLGQSVVSSTQIPSFCRHRDPGLRRLPSSPLQGGFLALSYVVLNLEVFGAVSLLAGSQSRLALGMGLFGILSIIKLRSSAISSDRGGVLLRRPRSRPRELPRRQSAAARVLPSTNGSSRRLPCSTGGPGASATAPRVTGSPLTSSTPTRLPCAPTSSHGSAHRPRRHDR